MALLMHFKKHPVLVIALVLFSVIVRPWIMTRMHEMAGL